MNSNLFSNKDFILSIIENSFDGIYITRPDGLTLYVNSAYEKLSGRPRSEYVGKTMDELTDSGIMTTHITKDVVASGQTITANEKLASGKDVVITGNPIFDENGQIIAVVTNIRDISEILRLKRSNELSEELIALYKTHYFNFDHDSLEDIICKSPNSIAVFNIAQKVAAKESTILITGETGTGKEVVAKYIHLNSSRKNKNYIKVNCGAISKSLIESELFGYVGGAFTGADPNGKPGLFEMANNGTLFLDEIAELPLNLQATLLRTLQDGEVTRIGDVNSRKVDVRIIAATNKNLKAMLKDGTFREDLYYRLNVISLKIPPLCQRQEDIPALAEMFINKLNKKYGSNKKATETFLFELMTMSWPGNIRELSNFIERQFVMSDSETLQYVLPMEKNTAFSNMISSSASKIKNESFNLDKIVASAEASAITAALKSSKNTLEAAALLGISQPTFSRKYNKYKKLGLL